MIRFSRRPRRPVRLRTSVPTVATAMVAALAASAVAAADPIADFYAGKTLTVIVGAEEGGPYANYARVLADHMRHTLPGNPTIIIQTMAGAGGVKMANYMYNVAPRTGAAIAVPLPAVPITQVLRPDSVRYDAARFAWLGNLSGSPPVLAVSRSSPATTLDQARTTELIIASSGKGSVTYQMPAMLNALAGTKIRIVSGYKGGPAMDLAIERGEVHGRVFFYENLVLAMGDKLRTGEIVPIAQVAMKAPPELADIPNLAESATTPEARQAFEFYSLQAATGRAFFAPPEVPAERVAALRKAFLDATGRSGYAEDMRKRNFPFEVTPGEQVQAAVERLVNTPKPVADRVRQILGF